MRASPFRFETLLQLRRSERDAVQRSVSEAEQAWGVLDQRRAALESDRQKARQNADSWTTGQVAVGMLLELGRYELQLQREVRGVEEQQALVEAEVQRRRALLVAADCEVKKLEKLRELALERSRAETLRREQAALDELAARQHGWRSAMDPREVSR